MCSLSFLKCILERKSKIHFWFIWYSKCVFSSLPTFQAVTVNNHTVIDFHKYPIIVLVNQTHVTSLFTSVEFGSIATVSCSNRLSFKSFLLLSPMSLWDLTGRLCLWCLHGYVIFAKNISKCLTIVPRSTRISNPNSKERKMMATLPSASAPRASTGVRNFFNASSAFLLGLFESEIRMGYSRE